LSTNDVGKHVCLQANESWRLTVDDKADLLHVALYVRDACGLTVPDDPSVPPAIDGDVADRSLDLDTGTRRVAGGQWLSWWKEILVLEAAKALDVLQYSEAQLDRLDAYAIVDQSLIDWPELDNLALQPELRRAVVASHDDAARWSSARARRLSARGPRPRGLADLPVRSIAEEVIDRLGASPGLVRAAVFLLELHREWSAIALPGLLLCSVSLAEDTSRMVPLLEAAFAAGVGAQDVPMPARSRKSRPLPASVLPEPLVLWERDAASLTCERVIPYPDGFEIELRRRGLGPQPVPGSAAPRRRPNQQFAGLQVRLRYADGREGLLDDVERPGRGGPITLSAFGRRGFGDDTLWLWVMPLPPPGEVRMTVEWPTFGIEPLSASFDGATIALR
jgi:hypothetical protein